jgi:hypothetical protein
MSERCVEIPEPDLVEQLFLEPSCARGHAGATLALWAHVPVFMALRAFTSSLQALKLCGSWPKLAPLTWTGQIMVVQSGMLSIKTLHKWKLYFPNCKFILQA